MRAAGALLRYQSELTGAQPLYVLLEAASARPAAGASMPATVLVLAKGAPLAGASVHFSRETGRVDARGTTGADGRATFDLPAPADATFMDFLSARERARFRRRRRHRRGIRHARVLGWRRSDDERERGRIGAATGARPGRRPHAGPETRADTRSQRCAACVGPTLGGAASRCATVDRVVPSARRVQ